MHTIYRAVLTWLLCVLRGCLARSQGCTKFDWLCETIISDHTSFISCGRVEHEPWDEG